jgi:prepilin-type N-terminal cleavage/methylation domain-containing protein
MYRSKITKRLRSTRGFTLVELLVVMSIISVLASTVLSSVQQAREKAKTAIARSNTREIIRAIIIAQGESNQRLVQFAPLANWTAGYCYNNGNTIDSPTCYNRVNSAMTQIETATNGIIPIGSLPRIDPWGYPYQMDASWGETSYWCSSDSFQLYDPNAPSYRRVFSPLLPTIPRQPRNFPEAETIPCAP